MCLYNKIFISKICLYWKINNVMMFITEQNFAISLIISSIIIITIIMYYHLQFNISLAKKLYVYISLFSYSFHHQYFPICFVVFQNFKRYSYSFTHTKVSYYFYENSKKILKMLKIYLLLDDLFVPHIFNNQTTAQLCRKI